jgi:enoyl-CoA hydratase
MPDTQVHCKIADHVAVVTLDRPPVNALSPQMQAEIIETFDRLSDREEVRAVVLTGRGRVFCAGADIKARAAGSFGEGERWANNRSIREAFHAIAECRKPVVAAINGPALGGGLCFVASCDILIASTQACLGLPEIDVGLLGGGRHAMRLFGHSLTRRMMMLGYRVSGTELHRLGVVEACVPPEELMRVAHGFARDLVAKSPTAIRLAKSGLNAIEEMSLRDGYRFEQDMTAQLGSHPDSREAMAAFVERRPARFAGS